MFFAFVCPIDKGSKTLFKGNKEKKLIFPSLLLRAGGYWLLNQQLSTD
jgi:hypothetical protein